MGPKFVDLPEMKMVGLGTKFISAQSPDKNNMKMIPALWGRFMQQISGIPNRKGQTCYGLVEGLPEGEKKSHADEMFYVACAEVSNIDSLPPGMIDRTVPAGRHAFYAQGAAGRAGKDDDGDLPHMAAQIGREAPQIAARGIV